MKLTGKELEQILQDRWEADKVEEIEQSYRKAFAEEVSKGRSARECMSEMCQVFAIIMMQGEMFTEILMGKDPEDKTIRFKNLVALSEMTTDNFFDVDEEDKALDQIVEAMAIGTHPLEILADFVAEKEEVDPMITGKLISALSWQPEGWRE